MSFALPNAFWLAACAVPIIVLYILKVRLRRQVISTNIFWREIYDERPPRSIWQHLRHLLSMLAQLCLLALLMFAAADPYLPWELLQSRRIVLVLDRSASMQAADIAPSRFGAAQAAALNVIETLRFRDEMSIIAAGAQPEVVVGMSSHIPTLKRALNQISVSDEPTDLSAAINLGKQLVGSHPRGEVLVYTDGCAKNLPEQETGSDTKSTVDGNTVIAVNLVNFGLKSSNVGITQFQVRRSLVDPLGYEVLVSVLNAADTPVQCRLELELAGVPVDVIPLQLKANEKWTRSIQKTSIDGGKVTARLTQFHANPPATDSAIDRDALGVTPALLLNALTADDETWAMLAPRKHVPVLLVTEGNVFLQKVFEANPLVRCSVTKSIPSAWPNDGIIVLHRQVPPELPPGDVLVIEPTAKCNAWDIGETIANPLITQQKTESPLLAHVRLDNVLLPSARRLRFTAQPVILVGTLSGEVLYGAVPHARGKCLVLSVDLDSSDLAFRTAFPIMITNALNWFQGEAGELESALATGQSPKNMQIPEKGQRQVNLWWKSPKDHEYALNIRPLESSGDPPVINATSKDGGSGAEAQDSRDGPRYSTRPFDECGIWSLVNRKSANEEELVAEWAVNLADERESDVRPLPTLDSTSVKAKLASGWIARPLWFYLAVVACLFAVIEWALHQRRILT
jgi:hypothetical protein